MSIFAVTSGKGGAGKSCIAAYTAAAFAAAGKRVLLVEAGFGFRSLDMILGAPGDVLFDFSDAVEGRCDPAKAIVETAYDKNLFLLPGPPAPLAARNPSAGDALERVLRGCASWYDIVIVDGVDLSLVPPALFSGILLVVTPDSLSVRAGSLHAAELYAKGAGNLRLVINNAPVKITPMRNARDFDDIIDLVGAQLIGVVPHSPILHYCSNNAEPLGGDTLTADIFGNIAARLLGVKRKLLIR